MSYNFDCKYFSGYKPCRFKRPCTGCPEYAPVTHRIAVLSLEALGAVMRSTVLLAPIRRKYPQAHITWITMPIAKSLLELNHDIDRILTVEAKNLSVLQYLQFDELYAVDKSLEAGALAQSIHATKKFGFGLDPSGVIRPFNSEAEYLYDVGLDDQLKFFKNKKAETQMITEAMGLRWQRDPYSLVLSAEEKNTIQQIRNEWKQLAKQVIGFNTGCSLLYPYKKFTLERSIETIAMWRKEFPDVAVALLGGPEDTDRQIAMKNAFQRDPMVINTPTRDGIRAGMQWMAASNFVFTGCSLGLHLGLALRKYIVAWFGVSCAHEIDLYDQGEKLHAEVSCSPCWKKSCNNEPKCFDQVSLEKIREATKTALAKVSVLSTLVLVCLSSFFCTITLTAQAHKEPQMSVSSFGDTNIFIRHYDPTKLNEEVMQKNMNNHILYQVVVDRFAGKNQNHKKLYDGRYAVKGDIGDPFRYHGGDLKGLIEKIDYLKALGITRLWLTPIFLNNHVSVVRNKSTGPIEITAYHGYWIKDWFQLDPFFAGTDPKDFSLLNELVEKAYPDIRIFLDTVANHTSPRDATPESFDLVNEADPISGFPDPEIQKGVLKKNGRYAISYSQDKQEPFWFNHTPVIRGPDWEDPKKVEDYSLEGLADFNQSHPGFQEYMREAHRFWMKKFPKLAGYRVDTIKHVPNWYWEKFANDLYQEFPTIEIFGEYFGATSHNRLSLDFYKLTRMSMFDFEFRELVSEVFLHDGSFVRMVEMWNRDVRYGDARQLINFIDSHDLPRLRGMGLSKKKMHLAIALMMLSRGIPCLYYGIEQDLFYPNDPGDPYNRPMMQSFSKQSEDFLFLKKLIQFRKQHEVLFEGDSRVLHLTKHILAVERIKGNEKVFFVMSKNPRVGKDKFSIKESSLEDGAYTDSMSGEKYTVKQGLLDVELGYGDLIVLSNRRH